MKTSMRVWSLLFLAAVAVPSLRASTATAAAPVAAKPLADELSGPAREAYDQAKELFEQQDFSTAHARFKQAYDTSKNPRLLWNMAACSSKAKRYAQAVTEAERFLSEGHGRISSDQEARAKHMALDLRKLVAEVRLELVPIGSTITLDGDSLGVQNASIAVLLEVGKHTFHGEKPGYEPGDRVINISEPKPLTARLELKALVVAVAVPVTARLVVTTDGEGVVELDGKALAKGTFDGAVKPGVHHLRIAAAGKKTYDSDIDLAAGSTRQLSVTLVNESAVTAMTGEQEKSGAWWPWAVGGAVLAAGAAAGGYYLFKPGDRPVAGTSGSFDTITLGR